MSTEDEELFRPEARAPKGFEDRRAEQIEAERRIVDLVSEVYKSYGFEALDTSAFEYADALGKFLPDADRPNKGVFALQDDDEQWMALRYDLTAPLARYYAQNWQVLPKPFRRYAVGPVWRDEKPGPGRFRQFIQCDADTVGSSRPEADAEIIAMAAEGLGKVLPRASTIIRINNRRLLDGILDDAEVRDQQQKLAVLRAIDKLDRLGWSGVEALLGAGRKDDSGAFTQGAKLQLSAIKAVMSYVTMSAAQTRRQFLDNLSDTVKTYGGEAALNDLAKVDQALVAMGVDDSKARFDVTIVRGLEYYTGVVFEADLGTLTDGAGAKIALGSAGGGGRYDDLVSRFTGESVPATGFSFGVSRIATVQRAMDWIDKGVWRTRGPVVVIVFDQDSMADYFAIAAELRSAGIAAEVYLGASGMKAQMKYADRRLSPAAVILGGDEIAAGAVTIKDLDLGRDLAAALTSNEAWRGERPGQQTIPRAQLIPAIQAIVDRL